MVAGTGVTEEKGDVKMQDTLIARFNQAPSFLVGYPLFMWFFLFNLTSQSPVFKAGWDLYTFYLSMPPVYVGWVLWGLTVVVFSVLSYVYFKVIFSNYWSGSVFFLILFFVDPLSCIIIAGSFFFLGGIYRFIELAASQGASGLDDDDFDFVFSHKLGPINTSYDDSEDFVTGYTTGAYTGPAGASGAALRSVKS